MSSDVYIDGAGDRTPTFDAPEAVYEALAHPVRSTAVSILRERRRPVAISDLATHIAARDAEKPLIEVGRSEHRDVVAALHHHHLPKLCEHDVVSWNRSEETVRLSDDGPIQRDRLVALLDARDDRESARLFETLSNTRRRQIITVLATTGGSETVSIETLSRIVAAREMGTDRDSIPDSVVDRIEVSLHHSHLPALSSTGLLEYDPADGTVVYDGHPLLVAR